jgi:hypothetical protein
MEESSPEDRTLTRERASAELRNAQSRKSWQRKGPEQPRSRRFLRFEMKQRDLAHATAEKSKNRNWVNSGEPEVRRSKRLLVKRQGVNASSLRAKLSYEGVSK